MTFVLPNKTEIKKTICSTCSYEIVYPLEKRCPICSFQDKENLEDQFELKEFDWENFVPKKRPQQNQQKQNQNNQKRRNKKQNQNQNKKKKQSTIARTPDVLFKTCDVRVSQIVEVKNHPTGDELYLLDINYGAESTLQIVAKVKKHFTPKELINRKVVTVHNLRPAKIRGIISKAMMFAGNDKEGKVGLLIPPESSEVGSKVYPKGMSDIRPSQNVNKKQWKKIVNVFKVRNGIAEVNSVPLVTNEGEIKCELEDGSPIH
ncbi:tRNA-aminoacylation cofactor arc1 family member [Anaeramoeba flamelloides]|uniref:tRNA-aminoacylation cofactor arc1 family member n=1 Tax=Anaeramoeba flamelloides TaxID=1746091 RepID=A0AAV8ADI1_9EUKA|nr:tRNA-aminoacylation cofactor arc1 family member [Anaeramoeba flamelloides]